MARTILQIQQEIIAAKNADATLSGLSSTSAVAIWRLWTFIIATCFWTIEKLCDLTVTGVNNTIASLKPHTKRWYAEMTLKFQYGFSLFPNEDYYNNAGASDAAIAASMIVKQAAVTEIVKGIRIKLAGTDGTDLIALTAPELAAVQTYLDRIKDAGVKIYATSDDPDSLKLAITIYYDALVLDATGQRLDGTNNTPVQDAVDTYLKEGMVFNGLFILNKLIDSLQAVAGVVNPVVTLAQAQYGLFPYSNITTEYNPDAGYLRIITPLTDLVLTFIPHEPV